MQCREEKHCPSCGHLLVEEEKIKYGGKNDFRRDPFLLCPACGWKRGCQQDEDSPFGYHL